MASFLQKDKHNFQVVTEVSLELIKLPLKDILLSQIKPEDLFLKIKSSFLFSGRNKLSSDQFKLCNFPPPVLPDYDTFDVSLLYTLIRNLCPGLEPTRGWGNDPDPKDTKIGDDIERLRLFRNKNFAHASLAAIPDDTFEDLYRTLKSVFKRLKLHPGCRIDYEQELNEKKCSKFRFENWECCKSLLERDKRACTPDISINGKDEVIFGNSVEFKANWDQSLFPVWSITWQKRRGQNIRCIDISEEEYSGSSNSKLLIRSARKEDEGEYTAFLSCEANGYNKLGSNAISLLVVGEVPFLNDLEVSTEEDKIIIHYNYGVLEKSPSVQHIEWRKNGQLLEKEKYIGGHLQAKTFTIISPSYDDRGEYSCKVSNAVGPITKYVNFDIPCAELSVEANGFYGSKATIKSMVFSCPSPEKVQWQKSQDKRVFLTIDITAPEYIGSRDVPKSAILVIPKISFDDKLFYRLVVWNKIGQNYSNIIYLNVTGSPPNITISQETNINNRSVKLCGNVFVYDNSPCILSVYWTKDGKKIDIKENDGRFSQVSVDEPSLNIKDVNLEDIGEYQLTATNAVGSTKSDVIKLGRPSLLLEKQEDENTGRQRFTLTIQSFPAPCHIQWSAKVNDDDIFIPVDINAKEYKGTTEYLPHPVLVVNQGNQLEKYTYKIEVESFVGSTIEVFSGQKYPSIIKKEGSLENTLYKDKGAGLKFAILNNDLANQFPAGKLKQLKFIIQSSGKVADVTSLKSADSAMECFTILQDENIFSKRDVIFMQFLCKETGCIELYEKCTDYALSQNALCYFERQIENGYIAVQFHVKGDLNNYTKEDIQNIVETVAGILNCRTDEILINGVRHSRSFMLVLSLKDIYTRKLMTLSEQDCRHLTKLRIDYFILNQQIFPIASSKEEEECNSDNEWIKETNQKVVSQQKQARDEMENLFEEKKQSKREKREGESSQMPNKRKTRIRRFSWSQFPINDEDTKDENVEQSLNLQRHQSLQDIQISNQSSQPRSFSHAQSCSNITDQLDYDDSDSDKPASDAEESVLGSSYEDSDFPENDDSQFDYEDDIDDDDEDFHQKERSFLIPKEDDRATKFEESCEYFAREDSNEEVVLQQDMMKYGLDLPISDEASHGKKKKNQFYEEFEPPDRLEALLRSNAQRYKRCKVSIQSAHNTRCINLDVRDELKDIEISGRSKAGKVFDGDIVLVEIFNFEKFTKTVIRRLQKDINKDNRSHRVYGRIVGLFERRKARDIDHPVFVCTLDDTANHLMRPVCRTVPKLHIDQDRKKKYIIQVYKYNTRSSNIEPDYKFRIDPGRKSSFVFLVVYLSWSSLYPMGAVIDVIEVEESFSSAMKILRLHHQVPEYYKKETIISTKKLLEDLKSEPVTKEENREELSHLRVFTIDPEGSQDLDDALSIEQVGDNFRIGVHIADVSLVVKKDDQIDIEARERASTFYPGQGMNPYHMLPEPLSRNICSLLPDVVRPTLSVVFTMTATGKLLETHVKKTQIKSCKKYTYDEVQKIIDNRPDESDLQRDILQLFEIAKSIRKRRAGTGFYFFPVETKLNDNEDSVLNSKEAHYLVEEFMVLANTFVAGYLSKPFPKVIPLRCQAAPSAEVIQKWKDQNNPFFHMVLRLQNMCLSGVRREDIVQLSLIGPLRYTRIMPIQKWVWENIVDALNDGNINLAVQYLCSDELHPNQCLALEEWISFQESASYKCSGALSEQKEGMHFSLQRLMYVHFTSPIRRYPDIIVHRLLHAAIDKRSCPYSTSEVDILCQDLNDVIRRAKDFQKQCKMLIWGFKLKQSPQILQGFVREATDRSVSLVLPGLRSLPQICKEFELNLLHVSQRPTFLKDTITGDDIMTLNWLLRLYDVSGKPNKEERKAQRLHWLSEEAKKEVCKRINPHARTKFIQQEKWKEILGKVLMEEYKELTESILIQQKQGLSSNSRDKKEADEDLHNYVPACKDTVLDHSSEVEDGEVIRQACAFSMSFSRGQVVCVQITAEPQKGVLVPSLQMLDMTKNIKHCLQHNRDPIKFLSKYSIHKAKQKYQSSMEYLRIWLPIIEMEAVTNAAHDDSPMVNGVDIFMETLQAGYFFLLHHFCEQRDIDFSSMSPHFILVGDDESKNETIFNSDFLCIRSEHSTTETRRERKTSSIDPNNRFQLVLHGQICNIEKVMKPRPQHEDSKETDKNEKKRNITEKYKVNFKLHRESSRATFEMLNASAGYSSCVELIQKSETETRIEEVLKCLPKSSKLAQAIALKRKTPILGEIYLEKVKEIDIKKDLQNIEPSNVYQIEAIKNSLNNSFSLIHGPPGTGKTYTGIKLVYLFDLINDMLRVDGHSHQQVVFCGPNNKSVDLVARWTLRKFENLDMIRLYGNSLENKDYPIPGKHFATSASSKENRPDPALKNISVHNLIRQDDSLHSSEINDFDCNFALFRSGKSYKPTIRDIRRFKHIVSEAAQEELKKHDVIFCTTAVTTSPRFIKGTRGKIFQLIIDEAGMCTEPESIAAIIATKAKQVVLIGDHKQLSPVISSTHAAEIGLQVSLFESYAHLAKMLRFQYRMHPEICHFPSKHFYEGKLITKRSKAWYTKNKLEIWPNKLKPIVFCHVEGEEEYLTVSTEEGNEQSCSNTQEVEQVLKVFEYLVKYEHVNPSNKQAINIMSQYNAQCTRIRKALKEKKYININVNTVVASQGGEWDYVIFSTARSLPEYRIEKYPTFGWCKQNLGFITDEHQINVALTRARRGLIIIGNKHLLSCDQVWKKLIYHYARNGCLTDVEHFPPPPPVNKKRKRRRSHRESLQPEEDFYRGTDRELSKVDEENE